MLSIPIDRNTIEKKLKTYQPLKYNRFRWWRWYEENNKPLPYKANFKNKILNGDYNHSCYMFQAYMCEYMLNELEEECKGDLAKYCEKSAILKLRRKKLWEDYEKDEFNRLEALYQQFVKHFKIKKPQVIEECLKCSGELIDLYYLIEDKYPKYNIITSKRGRPKK
jgi:hypothetical protein